MLITSSSPFSGKCLGSMEPEQVQEQSPLSSGWGHSWEDDSRWIQKANKWSQNSGGNGVVVGEGGGYVARGHCLFQEIG